MRISLLCLRLILFSLFISISFHANAKSKIPFLKVSEMEVSETFNHLQSFLIEKDYFVQSMDSKQRFVQIKVIPQNKGILKKSRRYTINFFVVPDGQTDSKIRLQINSEILDWNGNVGSSSYYYKDEGVLKAESLIYDDIIAELKQFYDQF